MWWAHIPETKLGCGSCHSLSWGCSEASTYLPLSAFAWSNLDCCHLIFLLKGKQVCRYDFDILGWQFIYLKKYYNLAPKHSGSVQKQKFFFCPSLDWLHQNLNDWSKQEVLNLLNSYITWGSDNAFVFDNANIVFIWSHFVSRHDH